MMRERQMTQLGTARQLATELGGKEGNRAGAPIRRIFAVDPAVSRTPLARLLQQRDVGAGSPGGSVRLRLYVSLIWACVSEPYDTVRPSRVWASLLNLDDPGRAGVRRIRSALHELEERDFIRLERAGNSSRVTILSEEGNGDAYQPPWAALQEGKPAERNEYFRVPNEVWTNGFIGDLDGPGMAMLLILLAESRGERRKDWFSGSRASESYSVSSATRSRGIENLRSLGLVTVQQVAVNASTSRNRTRNIYQVVLLPESKGR